MKNLLLAAALFFSMQICAQNYDLNFNGTNQYIGVPDQNSIDLSNNFTIEGWVYPTGPGSEATQGGIIVNKENSYEIARYADGTLQYALSANGIGDDWAWVNSGLVLPLNTWSHFALIKSGTTVTVFVNGAATFSSVSNPAALTANTQELRIGSRVNSPQFFNGNVDEIRIWNTARTLAEIKANIFNKNLSNAAPGLVAYYRMNENSGSTTTNSGTNFSGIDAVLVNAPSWQVSPIQFAANALAFDGTNDVVTIADDNTLDISTAITIEAWVYATSSSGIQNVVSKSSNTSNNGYIFPRTDDGWNNAIGYLHIGGSFRTLSAPYPSRNAWHHLAITYDGAFIKIYVNGVLSNSVAQTGTITVNANPLALGNQIGFPENFGGYADEIRIWNLARTQAEIQTNMNKELDPATQTGLVSYYTLNQGIAAGTNTGLTTVLDLKGKNNGSLGNFGFSGGSSNFVTQFSGLSVLPVSWLGFTAQKQDGKVLLNWSTASEQNTRSYIVQHSINGTSWNAIGNIQSAGNSSTAKQYSFMHGNPADGINYYRIAQEDMDGRISYSKSIRFVYAGDIRQIAVYPNPVTDGILHLQLQQSATVFLYSNTGILLMSKQLAAGTQQIDMGKFSKGIYQLKAGAETVQVVLQ